MPPLSELESYERYLSLNNYRPTTIKTTLIVLRRLAKLLGKSFKKASKSDIENLILKLGNRAVSTQTAYKSQLRAFYRWLYEGELPASVSWIKVKRIVAVKPKGKCLSWEDIEKMMAVARHPRDRCLVSLLFESGCRINEFLDLRIKDITHDEYGAILRVKNSKIGGFRDIRVVRSVIDLANWLDVHPSKTEDSFLFTVITNRGHFKRIDRTHATKIIQALALVGGVNKAVNPHHFRHSRATLLADEGLSQWDLENLLGWRRGSNMAGVYVHGLDSNRKILALEGIVKKEDVERSKPKFKKCFWPGCGALNSTASTFCSKCFKPLDAVKVQKSLDNLQKKINILESMTPEEFSEGLAVYKILKAKHPDFLKKALKK